MAGFRSGRGRGSRGAQQHGQFPPQHPQGAPSPQGTPYPQQGGGPSPWQGRGPGPAPYGQPAYGPPGGQGGPPPSPGEPEYFGAPPADPYANAPGHTQSFSVPDPYGPGPEGGPEPWNDGSTYHAGGTPPPPSGPRLHWKELLSGLVLRPNATFWQMRDHAMWGPALIVAFLYGLLAVFGFDKAREDAINSTISQVIPYVLTSGIAVVVAGLILGAVTHTLARQFGGDGAWQPTVGLAMLIMSMTDAPRLLFALFLGGDAGLVQILGWATWLLAGYLFTSMVSRSHDLPWPRALGASAIQLLALLFLIKLGTL
ncbi:MULTISPECIES: Yip1 family protein [Streptomyces]|uniref:Yip1 domain-containing protein n=1 Tax=Streptomyces cacaoi TaxID=1898 RepID=A0A4Y3R4W6_STRCI|nr:MULTISPECIES: Yip1 family protein [Streptomyces]NNG84611.1 YIP1 family protein [Streptomyces cacaoi]QHF98008.1 YIP1 family protein [Streptomyces sp. NHF165]GEB51927.1 hypothetical protein SCA03_44780 [Streptomyces cacaoi]